MPEFCLCSYKLNIKQSTWYNQTTHWQPDWFSRHWLKTREALRQYLETIFENLFPDVIKDAREFKLPVAILNSAWDFLFTYFWAKDFVWHKHARFYCFKNVRVFSFLSQKKKQTGRLVKTKINLEFITCTKMYLFQLNICM